MVFAVQNFKITNLEQFPALRAGENSVLMWEKGQSVIPWTHFRLKSRDGLGLT